MKFAEMIKDIRRQSLMSQMEFADALEVSFSTVNRWETGKTHPNYQTIKKIDLFCKKKRIDFQVTNEVWEEKR